MSGYSLKILKGVGILNLHGSPSVKLLKYSYLTILIERT